VEWPPLGLDHREVEALSERGSFQGEGRSDLKPSPLKLPHREEGIGLGSVGLPQLPAHRVRVRLDPALDRFNPPHSAQSRSLGRALPPTAPQRPSGRGPDERVNMSDEDCAARGERIGMSGGLVLSRPSPSPLGVALPCSTLFSSRRA
jgi:hypothetical protein